MQTQKYYDDMAEDQDTVISIDQAFGDEDEDKCWNVFEAYAGFDDPDDLEDF